MHRKHILIPILTYLILTACGGGGDDEQTFSSTVSYTGLETQAQINLDNANDMVEEMFGSRGIISSNTDSDTNPQPYNIFIPLALTQAIQKVNQASITESLTVGTTLLEVFDCDTGYLDYSITVDELSGNFNGQMTFHDCVAAGITLTGTVSINGIYDLNLIAFSEIKLSFPTLTGSNVYVNSASSGHIEIVFADTTTIFLQDYAVQNSLTGPIVKFNDYSIVLTADEPDTTLILTGEFYHPDYGYGLVSTPNPIYFTPDVYWPLFGQLIIAGSESSLKALFDDNNLYTLFVDTDGDNTTFESTVGYWEQPES